LLVLTHLAIALASSFVYFGALLDWVSDSFAVARPHLPHVHRRLHVYISPRELQVAGHNNIALQSCVLTHRLSLHISARIASSR